MPDKHCVGNRLLSLERLSPQQSYLVRIFLLALILLVFSACTSVPEKKLYSKTSLEPLPFLLQQQGKAQLQTYAQWIHLLKLSGGQIAPYHQQYAIDTLALAHATNQHIYNKVLAKLKAHVFAIQGPALKAEAQQLQQQFRQQVINWGHAHTFHNPADDINYPLGYEYGDNGIGGWIQNGIDAARTPADYQQTIEDIHLFQTNFQAMKENVSDQTPFDQPHKTDLQLLRQYRANGRTVVISLEEQAMRVYDQQKLVNAFLVTTGRPDRPSPPGVWWVEGKLSPTTFKSGVPRSSPDWYPDTPIHYAMQYHSNGYFIHDSWWRNDYGPGTNFPHTDSSGNSFSAQGSHGCVNISLQHAAWLYAYLSLYTTILIY
ncbi:MAG TPA: L,D-transpeptidase [Ktedonobacteraceae bacterium]